MRKPLSAHVFYPLLCAVFLGPTSRKPPVRSLLFVNQYPTKLPKKINLQLSLKFPQKIQSQSAESREEAKNPLSDRKPKKPLQFHTNLVRSSSPVRPCRHVFSFPIKPQTCNQPEKSIGHSHGTPTVLAMNSWGFYTLTFQFCTDLCFMFILLFYPFRPNCL
jgi:hypothetical protein